MQNWMQRNWIWILLALAGAWLAACNDAEPTPVVRVTEVAGEERPLATAPPSLTPIAPTSAPTAIPTPTPLPALLTAMIESTVQLKVQSRNRPFAEVYVSPETEQTISITNNYQENVIEIKDDATNQEIMQLPDSPYVVTEQTIFQVAGDNQSAKLTAYDLFTGRVIWEQPVPKSEWDPLFNAIWNAIVFIDNDFMTDIFTVYFFDQQTGKLLWQVEIDGRCPSSFETIEIRNTIYLSCYDSYFALKRTTGKLVYRYQLPEYTYLNNLRVIGNQLYLLRRGPEEDDDGYTVETVYLQAVNAQDLEQVIWQQQVEEDIYTFEVFEEDIVYRIDNRVVRLNGRTGEAVWETELITHRPAGLLVVNNWIFAGSVNGYLHLLSGKTGEVIWEQDIWATIRPRPILVTPVKWIGTSLLVYSEGDVLELGLEGETNWQAVHINPIPTPVPAPTQTPIPILPTLAPDTVIQQPTEMEQWPAHILAYLNSPGAKPGELEQILTDWLPNDPIPELGGHIPTITVEQVDLNDDQLHDLIINIDHWPGWTLAFLQTAPGQYELGWAQEANTPQLLAVADLNQDGLTNFVYSDTIYGASQSTVTIHPVGWQNRELKELSGNPISSTNVRVEEIQVKDIDADGFIDIVFTGGTYGSVAAGPNRSSTFTYSWQDGAYRLVSEKPELPQDYFFFLIEANQLLTAGKLEEAIALYENTMGTEDAVYYYNTPHQRAFAEFQIMLAYLLLGDETAAAVYAENGRYQDQLYGEVKQIFWESYQATQDWTIAAEAARTYVRLAGYQKSQLVEWVGYANTPLTLNDIVPCEECLQGTIGSDVWP